MRALCLVTAKPGLTDDLIKKIKRRRKALKLVIPVTGRSDICILLQGNINDINSTVIDLKKFKEVVSTETMMEVEVDLGW